MIKYENECVGCPPERGCLGSGCPYMDVPHYYCDRCGEEVDGYYNLDGDMICEDCMKKIFDYQELF